MQGTHLGSANEVWSQFSIGALPLPVCLVVLPLLNEGPLNAILYIPRDVRSRQLRLSGLPECLSIPFWIADLSAWRNLLGSIACLTDRKSQNQRLHALRAALFA